jgi:hypothetical protein
MDGIELLRPIIGTEYRRSVRLHWPVHGSPVAAERGVVSGVQSDKSRRRCAFYLLNAETDWKAMITLTYAEDVGAATARRDIIRFRRRMLRLGNVEWAWFREFTLRGRVHFHWFIGGDAVGEALSRGSFKEVVRRGAKTRLPESAIAKAIVESWIRVAAPVRREAFDKFQRGGILELLRTPDAAGRYAAKEAAKRVQKVAPPGWERPGRWWAMAPGITPRRRGGVAVDRWPKDRVPWGVIPVEEIEALGRRLRDGVFESP